MQPKVAVLKPLSSAISIGSGGPFGAEGPIIMTGGAIGSLFAQFLHLSSMERKTLLVAGAAGGMSATFNAPIAAALLAVELLLFEWRPRSLIPVALASASAAAVRSYLLGGGPLFPTPPHSADPGMIALLACLLVGTLAGGRLSTMMKRFAGEHPDVKLTLRTATSAEVSDLVRRGEATIGLRYEQDRSNDLDYELLLTERLQVVCAPDHPRAGRRVARLADLRGERWIAFPEIPARREITASHVFALFQTHGLGDVEWTPVDSLTAQKRLVEAGLGIALLSQSNVADERRSSAISTIRVGDLSASHDIVAVTRRDGFLSAASRRFLEVIRADYGRAKSVRASRSGVK